MFKYSETFKIRSYDADFNRQVSPTAVLNYMQELATTHAELIGLGYEDSLNNGFFWVIGRSKYDFDKMPVLGDEIEVTTWPAGVEGLCALRRFEFKLGGELIGEGQSYWLMIDTERFRPIKPQYFFEVIKAFPVDEKDHFKIQKVILPNEMEYVFEKKMHNSDLDWNNHVNNVKYAGLIYDAIPKDTLQKKFVKGLQINYLKEIQHGDEVVVERIKEDEDWLIKGKVEGKTRFSARAVMGK